MEEESEVITFDGDGWQDLMGKDIVMKVLNEYVDHAEDEIREFEFDSMKDQVEIGDIVWIDFDLYCIGNETEVNSTSTENIRQIDESTNPTYCNTVKIDRSKKPAVSVRGWMITVGDGEVPPALELAVRYLKCHKAAWVKSHSKYFYGSAGRLSSHYSESESLSFSVPPFSSVLFRITNRTILSSSSPLLQDASFRIKRAVQKKMIANDSYQHEWIDGGVGKQRALKLYGGASEALISLVQQYDTSEDMDVIENQEQIDSIKNQAVSALVDCFNNIAAYHLRNKAYNKAKEAATNALLYLPNNRKALLRAAKAAMLDPSGTYEESDMAIQLLEKMDDPDGQTKKIRSELERRKMDYKRREKAMLAKMVRGIALKKDDHAGSTEQPVMAQDDAIPAASASHQGESVNETSEITDTTGNLGDAENSPNTFHRWGKNTLFPFAIHIIVFFIFWLFIPHEKFHQ